MSKLPLRFWHYLRSVAKRFDGDRAAHILMRLARPVFFCLATAMLILGWYEPARIGNYFEAMAKAPSWLANILTILILGLAVEKGVVRPVKELVERIKGQDSE